MSHDQLGCVRDINAVNESAMDEDLFGLVRIAVEAAGAAADEHLAQGGYRPRLAMPTVRKFNGGWPDIDRNRLFPSEDSPTEYSALFGSERGTLKPFAYEDVPALTDVLAYVRDTPQLSSRLTVQSPKGRTEMSERMLRYEVFDLPLSILDRCRALNATDAATIRELYMLRERSWLLDPLPVEYVFPLALTALDLDESLSLDANVRIEPLDQATQAARAPSTLSMGVPSMVVSAATHAVVIGPTGMPNPGPAPRLFGPETDSPPMDLVDLVCQVLRIVSHVDVGYAQVLRRPLGWADGWHHDLPPLSTVTTVRNYPVRFDNYQWLGIPNPIPRASLDAAPKLTAALSQAPSNVKLAARRLVAAGLRDSDDDRTVDACIGLEALLGDGRDELTHRLALRAATALATRVIDPADASAVYGLMKKVYSHRSKVVHGTSGTKTSRFEWNGSKVSAAVVAEILLREVLTEALVREPGLTPAVLDTQILESLSRPPERT